MFKGPETFVIGNDSIKRYYIHNENKFVMAEETKVTKNFQITDWPDQKMDNPVQSRRDFLQYVLIYIQ